MKSYFLIILVLCLSTPLMGISQIDSTRLFYAKNIESAAFAEVGSNFIKYRGEAAMNLDISANWLVNRRYYTGAVYSQLASIEEGSYFPDSSTVQTNDELRHHHIGLRFGYIILHDNKIVSLSPDITGGWSGIKWKEQKGKDIDHHGFIRPSVKVVFNTSDYFRIGLSMHYQAYIGLDNDLYGGKQLNGLGGGVFLRIGTF